MQRSELAVKTGTACLQTCLAWDRSPETDREGCAAREVLHNGFIGGCKPGVLLPQSLQGLHLQMQSFMIPLLVHTFPAPAGAFHTAST